MDLVMLSLKHLDWLRLILSMSCEFFSHTHNVSNQFFTTSELFHFFDYSVTLFIWFLPLVPTCFKAKCVNGGQELVEKRQIFAFVAFVVETII